MARLIAGKLQRCSPIGAAEIGWYALPLLFSRQFADAIFYRRRQFSHNLSANFIHGVGEIVAAQEGSIQTVADNRKDRSSEADQELVRTAERMTAKSMSASPLDAAPLQQIVRLEMDKFVERIIRSEERRVGREC